MTDVHFSVPEAGEARSGHQQTHCRVLVRRRPSSLCVLPGGRDQGALWVPYRGLSPFLRAPPSCPSHLPQAPPPDVITLGVRASTQEFGAAGT